MAGLVVAALLALSLFIVHFSLRARPMPKDHPLDVDEGLPLPELAQSSTVFSLTGLFGAYLGIAIALGLPALTGLAFGTVLGLLIVRYWVDSTLRTAPSEKKRFETFLLRLLESKGKRNATVYAFMLSGTQCVYATCELLIFRELARVALGLRPEQATLLAIGVGVMGYFYVLFGGYMAVFRTDVAQLGLVSIMAVVCSAVLLYHYSWAEWTTRLQPRPGFWEPPFLAPGPWLYPAHFVIAAVMGLGQVLASPDTWKRVFQVSKKRRRPITRVVILVCVGTLPYLVLLPIAIAISLNTNGPIRKGVAQARAVANNSVFAVAALGLVASFLSAFTSALLASVHVQLMLRRKRVGDKLEEAGFYWRMVAALVAIGVLFVGSLYIFNNESLFGFNNAWLFGNILMGAYAAIAGVQAGTRGDISRLPKNSLLLIFGLVMSGWLLYFFNSPGFTKEPKIESVNTVPIGVGFFFFTALLSRLFIFGGRKYARSRKDDNQRSS
jgi:hypothetical protein